MSHPSSEAFSKWLKRLNLSYSQAALALGLCTSAIGFYNRGSRKIKKDDDIERDVEVPLTVLLACSAVEEDLKPIK